MYHIIHQTTDVTNSNKFTLKSCVVVVSLLYRIYRHNLHAFIVIGRFCPAFSVGGQRYTGITFGPYHQDLGVTA